MNFEGLDVLFWPIYSFPQHFCELRVIFAEKGRPRQWGHMKPHRAVPRGLAYGEPQYVQRVISAC
jgi:hypothetical protein